MDDFFVVGDKSFSLKHVVCITRKIRGEKIVFTVNLSGVPDPLRIEPTDDEAVRLNKFFEH